MASTSKKDGQKAEDIRNKTGGAYLPPAKLRLLQDNITDNSSEVYQRLTWEELKKRINGLINKVNITNIDMVKRELFAVNLLRGRGLFCQAIIRAQAASPALTNAYAALVAVCNTKFPRVVELLLKRLIVQFRRTYQRNEKASCITTARFIAHLVNQNVVCEVLALEMLIFLLEDATNDSVEVAIALLKEAGARLEVVAHKATSAIYDTLQAILYDGELEKRVQCMIKVAFALRLDHLMAHHSPAAVLPPELDLVEEAKQAKTHMSLELLDEHDPEEWLNVFYFDAHFQENEARYAVIKRIVLGSDQSGSNDKSDDEKEEEESDSEDEADPSTTSSTTVIIDQTEAALSSFRNTVHLTITSSLDVEECAHKLLKLNITAEQAPELAHLIVDCCAQQRSSYTPFFGNLGTRFCQLNGRVYGEALEDILRSVYDTVHRLETEKLRNVAKFFAHLLTADAIRWTVLSHIKLTESYTTSSSRVFIKILLQELAESLGLPKLNERIKDPTLQSAFERLFPRDDPAKTRFAVNFFTSIGLGGLTDDLRKHLKTTPTTKTVNLPQLLGLSESLAIRVAQMEVKSSSSSSTSSSASSSSSSDKKGQKQKCKHKSFSSRKQSPSD